VWNGDLTDEQWGLLRRYCRRWKIERLWAWLQNHRRIQTRCEYHPENYLGFVLLGCIQILPGAYL
jgi:transposase